MLFNFCSIRTLQKKDITAQEATAVISQTINFFNRKRTDSSFSNFYANVVEAAKDLTQEPTLARKREPPGGMAVELVIMSLPHLKIITGSNIMKLWLQC